ncbi:FtsX-like permease family protein [Natronorubrum sp. JWXQ-INN-674]|uniref:FtsX-like permease family protein n=1 Tax=Natronorubrum halalkaliphilum TaxID=2691917 RepID=A0A6B0VL33_9EURY|nr:ABC transporter permease [Natronorubrum halalkaliphilum]MXV61825.1 FtsX-like permease family protein [Natronorubrum halalkaliphilum]
MIRQRLFAIARLSAAQLRHDVGRTLLVILAIGLAVLAVTLLAGLGIGVLETGEERFAEADQDVWITGDAVELTAAGGMENPIPDSHRLADDIEARDDVTGASPLAFHAVYAGTEPDDLEVVSGVGVPGEHGGMTLEAGDGFSEGNVHYGDGDYDGPMTYEVILDPQMAERIDADVGDTIYVGTSPETASTHEFTVVGISETYSQFLGTSTLTMPLSELQQIAGTTGADRATYVTVTVADGADRDAVSDDLQEQYPEYEVRTSEEQLESMVEQQILLLASGVALVVLAVLAGIILTVNLLALVAAQQRRELAALRAIGLSRGLITALIGGQGIVLGLCGGVLGLLATPAAAFALNRLAASLVGFENLLRTPPEIYLVGFAIAVGVGTIGAVVAGWRASVYTRFEHLAG